MKRFHTTTVLCSGLLIAGCGGHSKMFQSPNAQGMEQWNAARASALTGLATDQLKDGSFDKCQQSIDQALALTPDDVDLHLLGVRLSIEQGRLDQADAHLAEARRLDPARADTDYLTGVLMERWQQYVRARAAYAEARSKKPNEVTYLLAEAESLVAMAEPGEALKLLESGQTKFQHSAVVRHEIGLLMARVGRSREAITTLRDASRLAPEDDSIREHLAFTLFAARDYGGAADVLDRLRKQTEFAKRADIHAAYGECMARTQHYNDGQKAYETATKLDADAPGYWLGLARTAMQAGDVPAADLAVRKAVSLRPTHGETLCLLGYVRLKQNQLPQALAAFRSVAESDRGDNVSVCLQGYVLARLGRTEEAKTCYARAGSIKPGSPLGTQLLATVDLAN